MARAARHSPILGAVTSMIGEASGTLVTKDSRFHHSFEVSTSAIAADPVQARKRFDEFDIAALAATMAEQGQLQPILLRRDPNARNSWIIVAGERRWRAAQYNGWPTLLAMEHDGDPDVAALIENLQRVDLSPVEEARGLQRLLAVKGWSQDRAADALGRVKSEVSATLRILTLPTDLLDAVLTSELEISRNVLVELARVEDPLRRDELFDKLRNGDLTIRAIRAAREPETLTPRLTRAKSAATLDHHGITRMARQLRGLREASPMLAEADREALQKLRAEIDALLSQPPTFTDFMK